MQNMVLIVIALFVLSSCGGGKKSAIAGPNTLTHSSSKGAMGAGAQERLESLEKDAQKSRGHFDGAKLFTAAGVIMSPQFTSQGLP